MAHAHRFLFAAPRHHPDRPIDIALTRDSEASWYLEKTLIDQGYDSGTSILNFPPNQRRFDLLPFESLFQVELPFLGEGDVLCQATRPPLSDFNQDDKKKVEPSNSTLERATFMHWWRYFGRCSRSSVVLRKDVASCLASEFKDRQEMTFNQKGCHYQFLHEPEKKRSSKNPMGKSTSAAFLLRVDEIIPGGPGLVAAWGLNAESTLAWCRMLRHRASHLLAHRGLIMVDLHMTEAPDRTPTYGYMDDWKFDVVLETKGELPPRPEEKDFAIAL
jgi:hypothetical protein